jgi:hypothetical protein
VGTPVRLIALSAKVLNADLEARRIVDRPSHLCPIELELSRLARKDSTVQEGLKKNICIILEQERAECVYRAERPLESHAPKELSLLVIVNFQEELTRKWDEMDF